MGARTDYLTVGRGVYQLMLGLEDYLHIAARVVPGTYQPAKAHERPATSG